MFHLILRALQENRSPLLFTDLHDSSLGQMAVWDQNQVYGNSAIIPHNLDPGGKYPVLMDEILIERIQSKPELILCGAGHVSVQTCKIAKLCNFSVTVIDSRADFANRERFPDADRIINQPFDEALACLNSANPYYVIVTRGHMDDRLCLESILKKPFSYCGMIGSRRKVQIVFDHMKQNGFSEELIRKVHAPIGIDIGANTPEEIGVSIVAEMIRCKYEGLSGVEWDDDLRNALETTPSPFALVTLVSKTGSAPRSTGARMMVLPDGRIISSIGGGFGEFEASQYALAMLSDPSATFRRYTCSMTNENAAESGMICGGKVDVLIQIVR